MQQLTFYSKRHGEHRTIVDDDVFSRLKKLKNLKWCVVKKRGDVYFQKRLPGYKLVELHRWIMNPPKKMYVDHINHDTQDNRKCNLRICLNRDNLRNGKLRPNNISGFTGVHLRKNKTKNRWVAKIRVNYKHIQLGTFDTFEEAVEARKKGQVKYWFS